MFTAKDIEHQRNDVNALREALDAANSNLRLERRRNVELDLKLTEAHRAHREEVRDRDGQISTLLAENSSLIARGQALHDENRELRQQLIADIASDGYQMSSGSGEFSDDPRRPRSTRHSKQESHDLKGRMKERINKGNIEAEASSNSSHKEADKKRERRQSVSKGVRKPYIEDAPTVKSRGPPASTRGFEHVNNYTTAPLPSSPLAYGADSAMTPRSNHSTVPVSGGSYTMNGDYYQEPLPQKLQSKHSSSHRKHHGK